MADEYTPGEDELLEAWIIAHSEPGAGGPVDIGGRPQERIAEGKRALDRVRAEAAREALDGLTEDFMRAARDCVEDGDHSGAGAWRNAAGHARYYRDSHHPKEDQ